MKSKWRKAARDTITAKLLEIEAQAALLGEDIDTKQAIKEVNAAYPFVGRHSHPYKIWRSEMKVVREFLSLNPRREARYYDCFSKQIEGKKFQKTAKVQPVAPGQTNLFGEMA
jgi:hypothetical protein